MTCRITRNIAGPTATNSVRVARRSPRELDATRSARSSWRWRPALSIDPLAGGCSGIWRESPPSVEYAASGSRSVSYRPWPADAIWICWNFCQSRHGNGFRPARRPSIGRSNTGRSSRLRSPVPCARSISSPQICPTFWTSGEAIESGRVSARECTTVHAAIS